VAIVHTQAIIDTATPIMRRAGVTTDDGKSGRRSEGRTNDLAWLRHDENETIQAVVERVANLIGLPAENAEKLQVIHYQQGQRYNRHADAYQPLSDRGKRAMGHAGNRMVTALFYLSEVKAGGGTGFSNLKMEIQAETGKLLVFHNCYLGTCQVHPDSVHAGLPVVDGDKWAVRGHRGYLYLPRTHSVHLALTWRTVGFLSSSARSQSQVVLSVCVSACVLLCVAVRVAVCVLCAGQSVVPRTQHADTLKVLKVTNGSINDENVQPSHMSAVPRSTQLSARPDEASSQLITKPPGSAPRCAVLYTGQVNDRFGSG
jgi:prolyl 4-hydroxylase